LLLCHKLGRIEHFVGAEPGVDVRGFTVLEGSRRADSLATIALLSSGIESWSTPGEAWALVIRKSMRV